MRSRITRLVLAFLLPAAVAHADGLFIESGAGVSHSAGSSAAFVRYQRDAGTLFGLESFYDVSYGSWNNQNGNEALALGRGIAWSAGKNGYLSFEAGLARVRRTTANLDTLFEILLRGACGLRIGRFDVALGFVHYSNGKKVLRNIYPPWWEHGPNLGEYFPTLQLGTRF